MKTYCVTYNTTTSFDVEVKARNKKEAEAKVLEVIPDAILEKTWETKHEARA